MKNLYLCTFTTGTWAGYGEGYKECTKTCIVWADDEGQAERIVRLSCYSSVISFTCNQALGDPAKEP